MSRVDRSLYSCVLPSKYLLLGQQLLEGRSFFAGGWNFGPNDDGAISVREVAQLMQMHWARIQFSVLQNGSHPHEANLLKLDCSKARTYLNWKGVWDARTTCQKTVEWYRAYYEKDQVLTTFQMDEYVEAAAKVGLCWTGRAE